jgi:hypothetical protein
VCSYEILTKIEKHEDWDGVNATRNPVMFIALATKVLTTSFTKSSATNITSAVEAWSNLRQGSMSPPAYYERALEVLRHGREMKALELEENVYALQFVMKARAEYGEVLKNFKTKVMPEPSNLAEAYELLSEFPVGMISTMSRESTAGEVIMAAMNLMPGHKYKKRKRGGSDSGSDTETKRKRDKKREKGKGTGGGGGKTAGGDGSKKNGGDRLANITCYNCQEKGHVRSRCTKAPKCLKCDGPHQTKECTIPYNPVSSNEHSVSSGRGSRGDQQVSSYDENLCSQNCNVPLDSDEDEVVLMAIELALAAGEKPFEEFEVGGDTMASVHIVKDRELLTNIRKAPKAVRVVGLAGEQHVDLIGDFGPFKSPAFYMPNSPCNLISIGRAKDDGAERYYDPYHDEDVLVVDGEKFFFSRRGKGSKTYTCDFTRLAAENIEAAEIAVAMGAFETVEDVSRLYTKKELDAASDAKELFARMAYPSIKNLITLLRKGKIRNCDVTPRDVLNCVNLFGPELAAVRGRTTRVRRPAVRNEPHSGPLLGEEEVDIYVDLMFVRKTMFLITVGAPMRYVMVTHLVSKRASVLKDAIFKHLAKYKRQGFTVRTLFTDGESGIGAIVPDLEIQEVTVEVAGPETHVGKVEVAIRYIKQMARSIVSTLPYNLSSSLIVWLIYHVASRSNFVPISTLAETITPREYMMGRQLDYALDLQLKFGERVEVHGRTDNSQAARTRPGIALVSVGNLHGSWKVLMLDTMKIATMDAWTAMPMDEATVKSMNDLADSKGGRPLQGELTFELINGRVIADDEPESVEELMRMPDARREREIVPSQEPDFGPVEALESAAVPEAPVVTPVVSTNPIGSAAEALTEMSVDEAAGDTVAVENSIEESADDQLVQADDPTDVIDLDIEATNLGPEPEATPVVEGSVSVSAGSGSRYGLRSARHYGHRDGRWEERHESEERPERGFRISVKAGVKRFGRRARDAILKELTSINGKGVFEPVLLDALSMSQKKKLIRGFIFLKEKFLPNGDFDKLKARLVAGGHLQDKSIYADDEIASPTASLQSIFMAATLAAREKRSVMTMDIGSAYLNADMDREVHMILEPEVAQVLSEVDPEYAKYKNNNGSVVVKLRKALYGCVESAKLWYSNISSKLKALGFVPNPKDECVFNVDFKGTQLTVCLYVDDLLCTCASDEGLEWLKNELVSEYKEVNSNSGPVHSYLGMTFDWSEPGKVKVTMSGYIRDMLSLYEVVGTRATPAKADLFDIDVNSPLLSFELKESFHSRVAKLLYLAKRVRPDILLAVNFLSTRVSKPTTQDWEKLARVLQYVNATPDMGMILEATKSLQLLAYVDASYAVHGDYKSHTGGILSLGMGPVFTKSKKQKLNTVSSTEGELVAVADMLPQAIWTRDWLLCQGYEVGPLKLFQDNTSTIHLVNNGKSNAERTRHIAVRYFWVKDRIEAGEVKVEHLGTADMIADFLSKPLQGELFRKMRRLLLNWE